MNNKTIQFQSCAKVVDSSKKLEYSCTTLTHFYTATVHLTKHELYGGKLHIYKRPNSDHWQCSTYIAGRNHRRSTKTDSLEQAKEVADDWYLRLKVKDKAGELVQGKTFDEAADQFEREYEIITEGLRNPEWVRRIKTILRVHLRPYFREHGILVHQINGGTAQEYRIHRMQPKEGHKSPAVKTLRNEIVVLSLVLKTAHRRQWIPFVPDLSAPFRAATKISHRAWFSEEEYEILYKATRAKKKDVANKQFRWAYEQLHDLVLIIANTGLRPDEAHRLEYRDVKIVKDIDTNEVILEIDVRGKRGTGHCKSMPGAVVPFRRLIHRNKPKPTDRVFPQMHVRIFNAVLTELGLKFDRDGRPRTLYSLRHSYICFRLAQGADIYPLANNCRTSVEMIEKHYAQHLKGRINAADINVRRPKPTQVAGKPGAGS
jgi:integrase